MSRWLLSLLAKCGGHAQVHDLDTCESTAGTKPVGGTHSAGGGNQKAWLYKRILGIATLVNQQVTLVLIITPSSCLPCTIPPNLKDQPFSTYGIWPAKEKPT